MPQVSTSGPGAIHQTSLRRNFPLYAQAYASWECETELGQGLIFSLTSPPSLPQGQSAATSDVRDTKRKRRSAQIVKGYACYEVSPPDAADVLSHSVNHYAELVSRRFWRGCFGLVHASLSPGQTDKHIASHVTHHSPPGRTSKHDQRMLCDEILPRGQERVNGEISS